MDDDIGSVNNMIPKLKNIQKLEDDAGAIGIKLSPRSHVLTRPETYIGSVAKTSKFATVFSETEQRLVHRQINWPDGCYRLFIEIITNSSDNIINTRNKNIERIKAGNEIFPLGDIKVIMNKTEITVENQGNPINTSFNEMTGMYNPDLIFGVLLSGTNYGNEKTVAGKNGIGAKATNVFSSHFKIRIENHVRGEIYEQEWKDNMSVRNSIPKITSAKLKQSKTIVSFKMDFDKFKHLEGIKEYPIDVFELYKGYCASISNACKVPVYFNSVKFDCKTIIDYYNLFQTGGKKEIQYFTYYMWPSPEGKIKHNTDQTQISIDGSQLPTFEAIVIDEKDKSKEEKDIKDSYVNGIPTIYGGVHYDSFFLGIRQEITNAYNKTKGIKKESKTNKIKYDSDVKGITVTDVSKLINIIIFANNIIDPEFDSQTKLKLTGYSGAKFNFNFSSMKFKEMFEGKLKKGNSILTWNLKSELDAIFSLRNKPKGKDIPSSTDRVTNANKAGKLESKKCTLFIVEGGSASKYARDLIRLIPDGKDYNGYIEIKGKILNPTNSTDERADKNEIIKLIEETLGLNKALDYSDPTILNTLRYGKVCILTDQDIDGNHIKALVIDLFSERYGTLLQNYPDFLWYRPTPLIRMTQKSSNDDLLFYSQEAFEQYINSNKVDLKNAKIKYYKGLGSNAGDEVKQDYYIDYKIKISMDENAIESLNFAFSNKKVGVRKEWLKNYNPKDANIGPNEIQKVKSIDALKKIKFERPNNIGLIEDIKVTDFINNDLIKYSFSSLARGIPSYMDGLKQSERKIVYGMIKYFNINGTNKDFPQKKLVSVASAIKESTGYHHDEKALYETLIGMSQDIKGTNNMPVFEIVGNQGDTAKGPKSHAAPRYLDVKPRLIFSYIYRNEDSFLYDFNEDEGHKIEPHIMFPIVPMHIINGIKGIATGFSTLIPSHNPITVIDWLLLRIKHDIGIDEGIIEKGEDPDWDLFPELFPWFDNFYGNIDLKFKEVYKRKKVIPDIKTPFQDDEDDDIPLTKKKSEIHDYSEFQDIDEDDEVITPSSKRERRNTINKYSCVTSGLFEFITAEDPGKSTTTALIYEFPIGVWTDTYDSKVLSKLKEEQLIEDYDKATVDQTIDVFIIKGIKSEFLNRFEKDYSEGFKLNMKFGISNIILIDKNSKPIEYTEIVDVIENFYKWRKKQYARRKKVIIANMEKEIRELQNKMKFYTLVVKGEIEIKNVTKEYISDKLKQHSIPNDIYNNASIRSISKESIDKMEKEINTRIDILNDLINTHHLQIWSNELIELKTFYMNETRKKIADSTKVTKDVFDKIIDNYINKLKSNKRLGIKKKSGKK